MKQDVVTLTQTCDFCPSQWKGTLGNGRVVYIRYRFGVLSWGVGDTLDEAVEASELHREKLGGRYAGTMTTAEMEEHLEDTFDFTGVAGGD